MELHEFHIFERESGAQRHAAAVAGAGVCAGRREIRASIAAGGKHHRMRAEQVQFAFVHVQREHATAGAVAIENQVKCEVFDVETRIVLERLLVQRVQHRVAGAVGRGAGALRSALAVVRGHAAERTLVDLAGLGARERHAIVLEFDHRRRRVLAHVLDRILVAEPVAALDRIVEVETPVVLAHVAECRGDAALRGDRVRARRENLGDARGVEPLLGHAEGGAQAGAARADHDDVVFVFVDLVAFHGLISACLNAGLSKAGRCGRSRTGTPPRRETRRSAPESAT